MVFVQSGRVLGSQARGPGFDLQRGGSDISFYFFKNYFLVLIGEYDFLFIFDNFKPKF